MVSATLLLSVVAVILSVLALIAVYDRLIRKVIFHFYDPKIEITLQGAGDDTQKQFHINDGFNPTYHDEFAIKYYKLPEREPSVDKFDPQKNVETRSFSISVHGYDTKKATVRLQVTTKSGFHLQFEPRRLNDPTDPVDITRDGPNTVYTFPESEVSNLDSYWGMPNFEIQMNEEGTYRSFRLRAIVNVTMDASEFTIPFTDWHLPKNIGAVEFPSIEREWEIQGPDHDEIDPMTVERYRTLETKKVDPEHRHWVAVKNGTPVAKFDTDSTTEIPASCGIEYVDDLDAVELDPSVLPEEEQHFFGVYEVGDG